MSTNSFVSEDKKSASIEIIKKYVRLVGILDEIKYKIGYIGEEESLGKRAVELEKDIDVIQQDYEYIISSLDEETLNELLDQLKEYMDSLVPGYTRDYYESICNDLEKRIIKPNTI